MKNNFKVSVKDYTICIVFFCVVIVSSCLAAAPFILWWDSVLFWIIVIIVATGVVLVKKVVRKLQYRRKLKEGVDFGIKQGCLDCVPQILEGNARRSPCKAHEYLNVAPVFNHFVATYSQVRVGAVLYSRKLLSSDLEICDDTQYTYRFICRDDDETYYCVRLSSGDERIFKLELELGKCPYPYASDIYHYIALRVDELGYMK